MTRVESDFDFFQENEQKKIAEILRLQKLHQETSILNGRFKGEREKKRDGQPNGRPHCLSMSLRTLALRGRVGEIYG